MLQQKKSPSLGVATLCKRLALGAASVLFTMNSAQAASSLPTFACDSTFYEVISGQLAELNITTGAYDSIGATQTPYNATGYNINDNYIYGLQVASRTDSGPVVRVGSDGTTEVVDVSIGNLTSIAGTMDSTNRLFYAGSATQLNYVDVATSTLGSVSFSATGNPSVGFDIAYTKVGGDDIIASLASTTLSIWNLTTSTSYTISGLATQSGDYGAGWGTLNGELFFSNNTSGQVYKIENLDTTPTVTAVINAEVSRQHDGMNCPAAPSPFDSIDYSDAPTSGTSPNGSGTNSYGDATHTIVSGMYLGAGDPDADSSSLASTNADGDDLDGTDDEEGIVIPELTLGVASTINATVSGTNGKLQVWVDWNGNGDFADTGEQLLTDITDNGPGDLNLAIGTIGFTVTPLLSTSTGTTYARFRWSSDAGIGSTGLASDGEVEDYQVTIVGSDATLTLLKDVVNDDSGSALDTVWTLSATDGNTTISGVEGDAAITAATVEPGEYTLSESGHPAYTQTDLSCTGAADTNPLDGLTIAAGENVTCTFTNDDIPSNDGVGTTFVGGAGCFVDQYDMTAADQLWTVPDGTYKMNIRAWGAGGPGNNNPYNRAGFTSGAGGYAEADFDVGASELVKPGDTLAVMVGESRRRSAGVNYGFGSSAVSAASGGGLSGVFLGADPILETDASRAILIAGGGGGSDDNAPQADDLQQYGGPGGDPATAGGNTGSMAGVIGLTASQAQATTGSHSGGAGGGYEGGGQHRYDNPLSTSTLGGRGGTSFAHPTATASLFLSLAYGEIGAPNTSDPLYNSPIATNSAVNNYDSIGHGQVVVQYCVTPAASLTLVKEVTNDNAGTAVAADWTLEATDGTTTISGVTGDAAVTSARLDLGTYTLSETGGPSGYTQTSLSCTGAADTDLSDGLTLAADEDVTCTFTNDDDTPPLPPLVPGACGIIEAEAYTLDGMGIGTEQSYRLASGSATHDPDTFFGTSGTEHGYTKLASGAIDYFFDGEAPVTSISTTMGNASYSNVTAVGGSEADQTDAAEFWRIAVRVDGVPGETYNFSTTNGNAHEFLHYWVEDSSGNVFASSLGQTNTANGWYYGTNNRTTSSAGGATAITSQSTSPISYTIPASNTDGIVYLRVLMLDPQAAWGPIDFDYECPVSLTLQKEVINDNEGASDDTDWTLSASDGTTTISGIEGDVAITGAIVEPGTYTLSESGGPVGYTQTDLSCTGAVDEDLSDGLTLVAGEEVTCTFTNDDDPVADQVLNTAEGQMCIDREGVLTGPNIFTDNDNGSFGTGSGAENEIPVTDPYPGQVPGGNYVNSFTGFAHGDFTYVSNHTTQRNRFQYDGTYYDPVNGLTGRFMISDPDTDSPAPTFTANSLVPGESYEISFWVADSEPANGNKQNFGVLVDGTKIYETGLIDGDGVTLTWNKYSTVYTHASTSTSATIVIQALETGSSGRDVFFDEVNIYNCILPDPKLTLEKVVVNDSGSVAVDTDWTLSASDGTTTISGSEGDATITSAEVSAGTYTLSEFGPMNYSQTSLACTGAFDTDLTDGLTLYQGENVTCTFTNDDLEEDTLVLPAQCGAWNHKGWLTYAVPGLHDTEVEFNSGDPANDPYSNLPVVRETNGKIATYFGAATQTQSGNVGTKPGSNLATSARDDAGHQAEYHTTVYRLDGLAGTTESVSLEAIGGFEFTAYWVENSAGTVLSALDFQPTWGSGIGVGETLPVSITYPADGTVYLYVSQFDPSQAYGRPSLGGYTCPSDFGDAPDSYGTSQSVNGAEHTITNPVYLGASLPDAEADSVPAMAADTDDTNAGTNDEDGVATFPTLTTQGDSYSLTVSATNNTATDARLMAWVDFDGNGTFDVDEAAARVIPAGTSAGNFVVSWSRIPVDIQQGITYVRLRITTNAINASEANGLKTDGEVEDYLHTIISSGVTVSGRVYIDADSNATEEASESGIGGTVVILRNTVTGVCQSVSTNGGGYYSFTGVENSSYQVYQGHGETTPTPQNCDSALANNPTGYQSTTADLLSFTVSGSDVFNQDFGEVAGATSTTGVNTGAGITFEPDNQSEILPGNVVFYSHVFRSEAQGVVRFTSTGSNNVTAGWSHLIYRDTNCNGVLDGTEGNAVIEGINLGVAVGGQLCIIDKVYAPANAPAQDQYTVETLATFSYEGGGLADITLAVTDTTTTGQATTPVVSVVVPAVGTSSLELKKTVENITQASAETGNANEAAPGDVLKYRIYYRNTGSGVITDLAVNDSVPVYTGFVVDSATCDTTPTGLSCTANVSGDAIAWRFVGTLQGGASGSVSYEVVVEP